MEIHGEIFFPKLIIQKENDIFCLFNAKTLGIFPNSLTFFIVPSKRYHGNHQFLPPIDPEEL